MTRNSAMFVSVDATLPPICNDPINVRVAKSRNRRANIRPQDRKMIAWDGEGINLSGAGSPQHYVLFGCSARVGEPLVITHPTQRLEFFELADYMMDIVRQFPRAFHVGYGFGYDQNMIIQSLRWSHKLRLYQTGATWVRKSKTVRYKVSWVPKKMISITKVIRISRGGKDERLVSHIKIEDIVSFFASPFIDAFTTTFPDTPKDEAWRLIVQGKASRDDNKWEDLPKIRRYWHVEILALEKLATGLRNLMWDNGFYLMQWYGPGAFANYLRRRYKLIEHEWGGKEANLIVAPRYRGSKNDLHRAIKCAYVGGHFEQYSGGFSHRTVYGFDLNMAYPAAFATLPTMREGGFWQELNRVEAQKDALNPSQPLTVYLVDFSGRDHSQRTLFQTKPMPLPYRDERGSVSYPPFVTGWYWSPEVKAVIDSKRWSKELRVLRAYRWIPADDSLPWRAMILSMYNRRLELKQENNPAQMVFKLGPNSLYGKMAQRVGYDAELNRPPKAHTLCIAGYITSWCRGMLLRMIDAINDDQLIAVETDGIYTTAPPEQVMERWPEVRFSKAIGEWGIDRYDHVIYLQNGVYLTCNDGKWEAKTRGIHADALPYELVRTYVDSCKANEDWPPLKLDNGSQFLGLGLSIMRSTNTDGVVISSKAQRMHCVWYPDEKTIIPTGAMSSKRTHTSRYCEACKSGLSLGEGLHTLHIHMRSNGGRGYISQPYRLPWETKVKEQWREHIGGTPDRSSDAPRATRHKRPARR